MNANIRISMFMFGAPETGPLTAMSVDGVDNHSDEDVKESSAPSSSSSQSEKEDRSRT